MLGYWGLGWAVLITYAGRLITQRLITHAGLLITDAGKWTKLETISSERGLPSSKHLVFVLVLFFLISEFAMLLRKHRRRLFLGDFLLSYFIRDTLGF